MTRSGLSRRRSSATGVDDGMSQLSYEILSYTIRGPNTKGSILMAEDINQAGAATSAPEGQGVGVLLDERELRTFYANAYRIHTSAEEVVIDLGFNMPNPNPNSPGGPQLLFKVTDRAILSYTNAKRLAMSLTQLIKRYEQQFGDINVQGQQRR